MTRAARTLGVTQPTLSAMLRRVEDELGVELFHRTARGVEPTEAGRAFLEHAAEAVRAADRGAEAVRALAGLEAGSIRVGGGATAMGASVARHRVVSRSSAMPAASRARKSALAGAIST